MTKPRLQISIEPRTLAVIRRLARSQKSPASRIVSELITDATPMMEKMADTLDALATAAQEHKERIRMSLADSEHEARAAAHQVVSLLDRMAAEATAEAKFAADARAAGAAAPKARPTARPLVSNRGATPHPRPRPTRHR